MGLMKVTWFNTILSIGHSGKVIQVKCEVYLGIFSCSLNEYGCNCERDSTKKFWNILLEIRISETDFNVIIIYIFSMYSYTYIIARTIRGNIQMSKKFNLKKI